VKLLSCLSVSQLLYVGLSHKLLRDTYLYQSEISSSFGPSHHLGYPKTCMSIVERARMKDNFYMGFYNALICILVHIRAKTLLQSCYIHIIVVTSV